MGKKVIIPGKSKKKFWFHNASVASVRADIRRQFPRDKWEKAPVWAYRGESWMSFHDPAPDQVIIKNFTDRDIALEISEDYETVKKLVEMFNLSRRGDY